MDAYKKIIVKGLPRNYTFEALMYNQVTDIIVAQIRQYYSKFVVSRLYYRHIKENRYHRIGNFEKPNYSCESTITSIKSSRIYFNVFKTKISGGGNWIALRTCDLVTKKIQKIFVPKDFILKKNEKRAWILNLIGVSVVGDSIFCTVGFERITGKTSATVDYYLCRLNTINRSLERLSLLQGVFL